MRTTTQEPLSSNDARLAILSCHEELRGLVEETMHVAEWTTEGTESVQRLTFALDLSVVLPPRSDGLLDPGPIRQKWIEHASGRRNWHYYLWDVLVLQAWREAQGV
jgi:hypothetical protein